MKNVRFTIINADIEEVCKAIEEGMDVKEFSVLYESPLDIDLDEVAYNPPVTKCQLWTPCNSEVTACFTNLKDGWDLRSPDFWKSHGKARCYERSNRKIKIIPRTEFH